MSPAMDKIRISKVCPATPKPVMFAEKSVQVENVQMIRVGSTLTGTLHLLPHHMIFSHIPTARPLDPSTSLGRPQAGSKPHARQKPRELWITYPVISQCTFRPTAPSSALSSSIRIRCRDFVFVTFHFASEAEARDVYETIRSLTCRLGRIDRLYAFSYVPQGAEAEINGWKLYDARTEFKRMGISDKGVDRGWRVSTINVDYKFSATYPALITVPSCISDNVLNYAGKYRSRGRIPALVYLHPINNCSITRSSQPLAGFRGNRSIQDEKLVSAIFSSSQPSRSMSPPKRNSPPPPGDTSETLGDDLSVAASGEVSPKEAIYGAQQSNLIVDARPTVNAMAMQAVGLGSENMDHYPFATKAYLGIDNIHVMRDSLGRVVDALKDSDITPLPPNRDLLQRSGWLRHITGILDGAALIARQVGINHSHVLIHCSDGWDRTSQLSALSQICLDPYYRTLEGFIVLVEKDWLSFGHMFRHRTGPLSHEKFFITQSDALHSSSNSIASDGTTHPPRFIQSSSSSKAALESALLSAKNLFSNAAGNTSSTSLHQDSESEAPLPDNRGTPSFTSPLPSTSAPAPTPVTEATKPKETSPVFHQFLDATYQLLHQHPHRFEFNERFLRRLLYHLYSCQYGSFLYNSERERVDASVSDRARSVWGYFLARRAEFLNPDYRGEDGAIAERDKDRERIILPHRGARWWSEAFGRTDHEMNGVDIQAIRRRTAERDRSEAGSSRSDPLEVDHSKANDTSTVITITTDDITRSNTTPTHTMEEITPQSKPPILTGLETNTDTLTIIETPAESFSNLSTTALSAIPVSLPLPPSPLLQSTSTPSQSPSPPSQSPSSPSQPLSSYEPLTHTLSSQETQPHPPES